MRRLLIPLLALVASTVSWNPVDALDSGLDVENALLARNWRPDVARRYARVSIEVKDLRAYSAMAITLEQCPATNSRIYLDSSIEKSRQAEYIEHELHHIADYESQGCNYKVAEITRDYFSLVGYRSVEIHRALRQDYATQQHYNHDLIYSVDWDITELPAWYANKYFWYMQAPAIVTQVPTATPKPIYPRGPPTRTPTPTPAPHFKVLIPRV